MVAQCRICAKPLPENATKCTECGEFQSLVRRILSGIDLHSLIALIPIATLAFVFIWERVERKRADIRIELVACKEDRVVLAASNIGNRAGIIGQVLYRVNDGSWNPFDQGLKPQERLLKNGDARIVELLVERHGGLVPFEERKKKGCKVAVTIGTNNFEQDGKPKEVTCGCPVRSSS